MGAPSKTASTYNPGQDTKALGWNLPLWHLDLGLPGPPELGYGWKVLVALSVTVQKERPQERPAASRP